MTVPEISGTTRLLGVIGWPVEHSRSPRMQNAALRAAGLDYAYVPLAVPPDRVGEAVRGLRALGFRGANVTIPHKIAVMEHLDELTPAARGIGAVNTITVEPDGRLLGDNTDCDGAMEAVEEAFGVTARGEEVIVIGAGGAARATAWGAAARGARRVTLVNRTLERAEALARSLALHHPGTEFRVIAAPTSEQLRGARLIFQMTSLGMKPGDPLPLDPALLPREAIALEAVYSPLQTAWMQRCRDRGIRVVDGLAMLVAQGARSFQIWTGQPADRAAMRQALSD